MRCSRPSRVDWKLELVDVLRLREKYHGWQPWTDPSMALSSWRFESRWVWALAASRYWQQVPGPTCLASIVTVIAGQSIWSPPNLSR